MDRHHRRPDGSRRPPPLRGEASGDIRVPERHDDDPDRAESPQHPHDYDDCCDQLPIPERG